MKRFLILLCAVLMAAVAAPQVRAQGLPFDQGQPIDPAQQYDPGQMGGDPLSIDAMYDMLSPYGDWIYTPNYGYVWQPMVAQNPGWAPYADGSWAYTDAGWTWISNEEFGWLTYHYGRWIRLMNNWMWVPGSEWAPAWVSWRQTQGQIGWAPLPPEAMWSQNVGFGGWTDSYYDVGPTYYNFVPNLMFASSGSMLNYILDRRDNFGFYGQSVNVTNTCYRPNVMHHIFVGGPNPLRFDGLGGNHLRRLTLRQDDAGFRQNFMDRRGGGQQRGAGGMSRIEQGQLVVAAPAFSRGASQGLPARVRESLEKPVMDRGWHGAVDLEGAQRLRIQQHDELARTRPAVLPEKHVQPATSTAPPPAFGRVLNAEERLGRGGPAVAGGTMPQPTEAGRGVENERLPMTPRNPLPSGGPPGIPQRVTMAPGGNGVNVTQTGRPHHERMDTGVPAEPQPGVPPNLRPGENFAPAPGGAGMNGRPGFPHENVPQGAGMQPGFQGHHPMQPSGNGPAERPHMQPTFVPPSAPVTPPRLVPAPQPQMQPPVHFQPPPQQQRLPQVPQNVPHVPQGGPGGRERR